MFPGEIAPASPLMRWTTTVCSTASGCWAVLGSAQHSSNET